MTIVSMNIDQTQEKEEVRDRVVRVLVVDDSALYRKVVTASLKAIPNVEVIGSAPDGAICLQKVEHLKPDLITLDLELPDMNGLEILQKLKESNSKVLSIIVSAFTREGGDTTLEALERGAIDFVTKPSGGTPAENAQTLCNDLATKIGAFTHLFEKNTNVAHPIKKEAKTKTVQDTTKRVVKTTKNIEPCEVVVIGISTGGPEALKKVVPHLPKDFPVPVLIVQHMPPIFTQSLAKSLNTQSELQVREAVNRQVIKPGEVWIAPGGKQMKVVRRDDQVLIKITDDPPILSCKPSVDYLFKSITQVYGPRSLGVIMTGMGHDGTDGCRDIKRAGGTIVAQNEDSCVVFGMPRIPIKEGLADATVPVTRIAKRICELVGYKRNYEA